ncbi:RidA family protein [Luteimonas gilva]|uniref:RidA family protein n=2 Tax=Luteimonas gilva TaxID=2572684 RepID=A0A4U5JYD6_9GAMM|nr:RidA family protein [Luteimonas gilva]
MLALSSAPFAYAQKADSSARYVNPQNLPKPNGYSHAVEVSAGRTLYVSGQLPLDKDGNLVGNGDFAAQAGQVFANLKTALEASGATFKDVVKLNMFVTDMDQLKALREARDKYIDSRNPPASTLVEVKRFVKEGAMVEIDAIAVVPERSLR